MKKGYFCLGHVFVYGVIEGFNNVLDRSSSLQGYVRTRQQHKLQNVLHNLGIVLWWIRGMPVNVTQTFHYYGYNVIVNKQRGSVLKKMQECNNTHLIRTADGAG
jgi:hypothetical protein